MSHPEFLPSGAECGQKPPSYSALLGQLEDLVFSKIVSQNLFFKTRDDLCLGRSLSTQLIFKELISELTFFPKEHESSRLFGDDSCFFCGGSG
ncbi:MAG: hypothetical protein KF734_22800 [Saprospiraceae bacterium]|nr:hypothetical protein [Saprospiraceae bacterium]